MPVAALDAGTGGGTPPVVVTIFTTHTQLRAWRGLRSFILCWGAIAAIAIFLVTR